MPRLHGVDVSVYQRDWQPAPGDAFAFVKATQGRTYLNPEYGRQIATARAAGMVVGAYHFLHPGNAKAQAAYFVAQARPAAGDLLVCDWENTPDGHPSVEDAAIFIAEVKRLRPHNRVGLYCNRSSWMTTTVKAGDFLWIAEYGVAEPATSSSWMFHQYTDKPIDQNRCRLTSKAELVTWSRGLIPTAPTKPPAAPKTVLLKMARATKPRWSFDLGSVTRRDLWQGIAWSPRVTIGRFTFGYEWIIQQAYPGKVEDQVFHRFSADGKKLLGTMVCTDSGHGNGNFHIRRSAAGNLWVWIGWNGRLVRAKWRKGTWRRGQDKNVQTLNAYTTSKSQSPIPTDPWRIVIRTATDTTETFTERPETSLTTRKANKVTRTVTISKKGKGTHQGAAAFGNYIYTVNGSTGQRHYVHQYDWKGRLVRRIDISDLDLPGAWSTSDEPEGLANFGGTVVVLKRYNSTARRRLAAYPLPK